MCKCDFSHPHDPFRLPRGDVRHRRAGVTFKARVWHFAFQCVAIMSALDVRTARGAHEPNVSLLRLSNLMLPRNCGTNDIEIAARHVVEGPGSLTVNAGLSAA